MIGQQVVLGLLVWFCAKRISKKPIDKNKRKSEKKETKEIDMEVQETHVADAASTLSIDVLEKRQYMDQESLIANPPSPFIRRPTQPQRQENQIPNETTPEHNRTPGNSRIQKNQGNSRIQENQGNLRMQENQGNLRMQENQGNLRMQENQGNSRITQSLQGLPPVRSLTYNNPPNSKLPIVHQHNTTLPSQRLTNYQQMPQYVPDMRPLNGNGMMFPPTLNQAESVSGFQQPQQPLQSYQPHNKVPFSLGHKRSDSFPQSRSFPLPPIPNNPGTYQVSQQSAHQGNNQYKIDQPSIIQPNVPYLSYNNSRSLPNLHDNITESPIPPIPSIPVPNSQQQNNIITPMSNNVYSQPKTPNPLFKSLEESKNIIPNSDNRDSLKRMRRKSAHNVRGE
ncbi:12216_t:CDS:2, partial [Racocetra fulgida]